MIRRLCSSLLFLFAAARVGAAAAEGYNFLFITLDTTRADRLGCYGYAAAATPNLDALARGGARFADCVTPCPLTLPAHCSLFTGLTPLGHGVRNNATYVLSADRRTLAELLRQRGYHTYAVVAAYVLLAKFGLGRGFDVYDDSLDVGDPGRGFSSEINAGAVYDKFRVWFERSWRRRFCAWVHLYDPHQPYAPPPPYAGRFPRDPYSGEIAYLDSVVGRILADLRAKGVLERTLVIVAGDHGEDLGEHREFGHGIFCYQESLRVPLIVSAPRLIPPRVIGGRVNLVDVLPTVCDLLGVPAPGGLQGTSLKPALLGGGPPPPRDMYFESLYAQDEMGWAPLTGILSDSSKYIKLPEAELYDLDRDPRERENLYLKENVRARGLDRKLQALMLRLAGRGAAGRRQMSAEDRRHLASLGYLSSLGQTGKAVDPKRGNAVKDRLREVKKRIVANDPDGAERELKDVMAANPEIKTPIYYDFFEEIYKLKKDMKRLFTIQREAIAAFPRNLQLKYNLASNLFHGGDLEGAGEWCGRIIAANPAYTQAYILLGNVRFSQERIAEAKAAYEKALAIEPQNLSLKKRLAVILARQGDPGRALALLDELAADERLAVDQAGRAILAEAARLYAELGRLERGDRLLRGLLARRPDDAMLWNELGSIHYQRRDLDVASDCFERALAADANFAPAHANLGALRLARALQRRDAAGLQAAADSFDRAIALDPALAPAFNGRAVIRRYGKRIAEAVADWRRALELDPGLVDAHFNLGITLLEGGDRAGALVVFNRCRELLFSRLPVAEQKRLLRLIGEAGGA
jgi:arylsulfatase A-like enzyme/Tfp pilus assembly protein PilF